VSIEEFLGDLAQRKENRVTTNDSRSRAGSDKMSKESKDAAKWVQAGFSRYAKMCGRLGRETVALNKSLFDELKFDAAFFRKFHYKGGIHKSVSMQIKQYGDRFDDLLRDKVTMPGENDSLKLRLDLQALKKSGCPALALAELLLACTSPQGVTVPYLLFHYGTLDAYLSYPKVAGSPKRKPRSRHSTVAPPLSIRYLLNVEPPPVSVKFYVAYFYIFLKSFGRGYDTLSRLLRAMQYVRRRAPTVADYLQSSGRYESSLSSLQKLVPRYFKAHPCDKEVMLQTVVIYSSSRHDGLKLILQPASYMPQQNLDATVDWIIHLVSNQTSKGALKC
jgi:hypothetical protein